MDSQSPDARTPRIHWRPTLLPGGRLAAPVRLYLTTAFAYGLITALWLTTYGLYVVREAQLTPLQLVLVGTGLEAATFVAEVPTGIIADVYSRRLSIVIGQVVSGVGLVLMGAVPGFLFVLLGHIVWGVGWTFGSGAREAWLADEIGEEQAAPVYVRAEQSWRAGRIAGIPAGVGVALVDLQATFLLTGALSAMLALGLAWTMGERGYQAAPRAAHGTWRTMGRTARGGLRTIRGRPVLVAVLGIALLAGASSEALDRLWPLHLVDRFDFPPLLGLGEAGWFGAIEAGSLLGGIAAAGVAGRLTRLGDAVSLVRTLSVLTSLLVVAALGFALADAFVLALLAYWGTAWVRAAQYPLMLAWVNRGLDPRSRATVLSMLSQADALGQLVGGPTLGIYATLRSVRAALVAVGLVLLPSLGLYVRALRQEGQSVTAAEADEGEPTRV